VKAVEIDTKKSELTRVPEAERTFFLLIGHLANELNVLNKLLFFCSQFETSEGWERRASTAQALVVGKILAGKLSEGWELLQRSFFSSKLSQLFEPLLAPEAKEALGHLKRYFGKENLIRNVRNRFSFHYSVEDVRGVFDQMPDTDEWQMCLADSNGNSLYYSSELVVNYALLDAIAPGTPQQAMEKLLEETTKVTGWFIALINGCMVVFAERHLLDSDGKLEMRPVAIADVPSKDDVRIPYFIA